MASASRQLNYTGTFVYRNSRQTETSRIVHFVNPAGGEFEKLETLDGPPREVIRTNDQVTCYLPELEDRARREAQSRAAFPAHAARAADRRPRELRRAQGRHGPRGRLRVPGDRARAPGQAALRPPLLRRDRSRACRCARAASTRRTRPLESFAFTQLTIGGDFNRDLVKSRYAAKAKDWKVDRSAHAGRRDAGRYRLGPHEPAARVPEADRIQALDRRAHGDGRAHRVLRRAGRRLGVHRADAERRGRCRTCRTRARSTSTRGRWRTTW